MSSFLLTTNEEALAEAPIEEIKKHIIVLEKVINDFIYLEDRNRFEYERYSACLRGHDKAYFYLKGYERGKRER